MDQAEANLAHARNPLALAALMPVRYIRCITSGSSQPVKMGGETLLGGRVPCPPLVAQLRMRGKLSYIKSHTRPST